MVATDEQLQTFTLFLFYSSDKMNQDSEEVMYCLDRLMDAENEFYIHMKEYFFFQEKLVCVFD